MKNLVKVFAILLALVANIGLAGTASAEPAVWTPELTQAAHSAQADANGWATSLGNSSPGWAYIEQDQPACDQVKDVGALYCYGDSVVYMAPMAISKWMAGVGHVGALFLAGHEITHHFQHLAAGPVPASTALENQATCGAGVFVNRMVARGSVSDADVQHLLAKVSRVQAGTVYNPAELSTAFNTGYSSGHLSDCVNPGMPIAGA